MVWCWWILVLFLISHYALLLCSAFNIIRITTDRCFNNRQSIRERSFILNLSSDWITFQALDDDENDEIVFGKKIDRKSYASEDDDQILKATVGSDIDVPTIKFEAEPIFVPAGSQLALDENIVQALLSACRQELGTLFGYTAENRGVGITGSVEFVELDGGTVILSLQGRFWHQRRTVLERISNYLKQRVPEIVDVSIEDPWQLTDEANS